MASFRLSIAGFTRAFVIMSLATVLIVSIMFHQKSATTGSPIVNGYLNPWEIPFRHSVSLLRDPMPWEDGYFDPSYHAWPKNRQQQVGDKQSVKLTNENGMLAAGGGGSSSSSSSNSGRGSSQTSKSTTSDSS